MSSVNESSKLPVPNDRTILALGSIVIHCEEFFSPDGHEFDKQAILGLLKHPDVREWIASINPVLLPMKRK